MFDKIIQRKKIQWEWVVSGAIRHLSTDLSTAIVQRSPTRYFSGLQRKNANPSSDQR
jgi:hypothetical protein